MATQTSNGNGAAALLSAVALLRDLPEQGLVRGEVGTIVEALDDAASLVEFSDDRGEAYAIVPCPRGALLVLKDNSSGGVIAGRGDLRSRQKVLIHNGATPKTEVDPGTYDVRADGELLVCEPAERLPMAQRYFVLISFPII